VLGSNRVGFPVKTESLLLSVAANQASIGLQEAKLLREQKRIAAELERRVAARTQALDQTNAELRREIAERRRAEDALRGSEQSLRLILDGIAGLVAIMGATGEVEAVNRQVLDYFGRSVEEIKQWSISDAVHPDDLPGVTLAWRHSVETLSAYDIDHRLRHADNVYRWFHARGLPLLDAEGRLVRWYVLLTDIDDRRRAEEALRASEVRSRRVIDTIPTLAWCNLPDGPNESLNKPWHDYTGLSPEESHGWGWQVAFHPEDLPALMKKWRELLTSGEPGEIEARLRRRDGVYRWFLIRVQPFRNEEGKIVRWYGTSTDIEDRKLAQEALARSEAFLAEGQHLSRTGSFSLCVNSGEITCSEQLYRIFEFEQGTTVTLERIGSRIHPEDRPTLNRMIDQVRAGVSDFEYEHRLLMPDNSVKYLHLTAHGRRDAAGRLEYIGAAQDVTQRRFSEEALGKARLELAKAQTSQASEC
jgi:PAS domain S-box-containing protein